MILKSIDGGNHWNNLNSGTHLNLNSVYLINDSTAFAVGDSGIILKTNNYGLEWESQSSSVKSNLNSIYFISADTGFVCGNEGIILKTTSSGISSIHDRKDPQYIVRDYPNLHQNYPNPFNSSTTISYDIPKSSHIILKIYNLLGQEIKTLINHKQNIGSYSIKWHGRDNNGNEASSGIYIYTLKVNSNIISKKLLLLK